MDLGTVIVTNVASLVVGLVGGYGLQVLAARRSRQERKALSDLGTLERCVEIFNARVEYVIAYHTGTPAVRTARNDEYLALYYGNLHALPETHVPDETWQVWMRAERDARDARPSKERMAQVKEARLTVLGWLAERRTTLGATP